MKAVILDPDWVMDMYWTDAKLVMAMYDRMANAGLDFDGAFLYWDL